MAAPLQRLARRMLGLDGAVNALASSTVSQKSCFEIVRHTASSSISTKSSSKVRCTAGRPSHNAHHQSQRTFFGMFKDRTTANKPQDALPYEVVLPGNISPIRSVPDTVLKPEYASSGIGSPIYYQPILLDDNEMDKMREAGKMARKILDIGASYVKPGVTTDVIDEAIHTACLENNVYPSTLNYKGFPKSVCTSVNNVLVHGIPDDRPLKDGDMVNIDFTVFMDGYHGDVSETYPVGTVDEAGLRLIEVARQCRDEAIRVCEPMHPISNIGTQIQSIAHEAGFFICASFVGHGIGKQFHCKPDIWHYANTYPEKMTPGMAFTIEPVIMEKSDAFYVAEDGWTVLAEKQTRSAQFEHTVLMTHSGIEVLTASADEHFETSPRRTGGEAVESSDGKSGSASGDWKFD